MPERTTVVIFGATGDLAQRKLLPALFELRCKGRLPENAHIVAFARSEFPADEFCDQLWKGVGELGGLQLGHDEWDDFAANLTYVRGDLTVPEDMARLGQTLTNLEAGFERGNRLFYLPIAPQLYQPAMEQLGASGIAADDTGWRRVVIEKPFGWDLASATELNHAVHKVFGENEVFRIDHYLGKETVQNIQVFRFSNVIFEPVWNRSYIDNVQITVADSVTVGDQRAGALRIPMSVVRDVEDDVVGRGRIVQSECRSGIPSVGMVPAGRVSAHADSTEERSVAVVKREPSAEDVDASDSNAHHRVVVRAVVPGASPVGDVCVNGIAVLQTV